MHGSTTAFATSGGIFVVGAAVTAVLLPSNVLRAAQEALAPLESQLQADAGPALVSR